ncbi:hypothetical protein AADZ84_17635, partial [Colwelliaceae bacterium MEBiC 14330]
VISTRIVKSMWENLSKTQKFLFIALMCFVAPFAPEFILLADIGGIELVFSFLVLYYKPVLLRIQSYYEKIKIEASICISAFKSSATFQPKVFATQTVFSITALIVTGSFFYASVFFMPALMFNGVLV